jgi:hypothetical protein
LTPRFSAVSITTFGESTWQVTALNAGGPGLCGAQALGFLEMRHQRVYMGIIQLHIKRWTR